MSPCRFCFLTWSSHRGVSENNGFSPQIIHLFIGFSIIFTIHFGGNTPYFWFNTHGVSSSSLRLPSSSRQVRHHCEIRGRGHGGIRSVLSDVGWRGGWIRLSLQDYRWWQLKDFLFSPSPILTRGFMIQLDLQTYFSDGLVQPATRFSRSLKS